MAKDSSIKQWFARAVLLTLPASALLPFPHAAAAEASVREARVVVDGVVERFEQPAFLEEGTYYMPVRALLTRLGYEVQYEEARGVITARKQGRSIELTPDSSRALVDAVPVELNRPVKLVEDTTFFPAEPLLAALGYESETDGYRARYYLKSTIWQRIAEAIATGGDAYRLESSPKSPFSDLVTVSLYMNDELVYAGSWLNGTMHGPGKVYDKGRLVYEGALRSNLPHGSGIRYDASGLRYEGEFKNGLPDGQGQLYSGAQLVYDGLWTQGRMHGSGKQFGTGGKTVYEGAILNGLREGYGVLYDESGRTVYEGNFAAGQRAGQGKAYGPDGKIVYSGFWAKDQRHGSGSEYRYGKVMSYGLDGTNVTAAREVEAVYITEVEYAKGLKISSGGKEWTYRGAFTDKGEPHGQGEIGIVTGNVLSQAGVLTGWELHYRGEFQYGKMTGIGQFYDGTGKAVYYGQVLNGRRNGQGTSYANGLQEYTGAWRLDVKDGTGWEFAAETAVAAGQRTAYRMTEVRYDWGTRAYSGNVYKVYPSAGSTGLTGQGSQVWIWDVSRNAAPSGVFPTESGAALVYTGSLVNGLREGQGVEYLADGSKYTGSFKANLRHGSGRLDGTDYRYEGQFENNLMHGAGKYYQYGYLVYSGDFKYGERTGNGIGYRWNGTKEYEGEFKNGKKDGYGVLYGSDGMTVLYKGLYKDGIRVDAN